MALSSTRTGNHSAQERDESFASIPDLSPVIDRSGKAVSTPSRTTRGLVEEQSLSTACHLDTYKGLLPTKDIPLSNPSSNPHLQSSRPQSPKHPLATIPNPKPSIKMVILPPTEEPAEYNNNYVLYWNNVGNDLNRLVNSIAGPQNEPPTAARALGILHLAIHDAYFALRPDPTGTITTYLTPDNADARFRLPALGTATDARLAVAAAANTVLLQLYTTPSPNISNATTDELTQFMRQAASAFPDLDTLSSSYRFGVDVGMVMLDALAIGPDEADQDSYRPRPGQYRFNDDPTNPIRIVPVDINNPDGPTRAIRVYGAPFYGLTARRIAVQHNIDGVRVDHILADPPVGFGTDDLAEYNATFDELIRQGGATSLNTTIRTPEQTLTGYYWAYDGVNLIGTPVREFNQILRKIAWENRPADPTAEETNADFARLFAIVNVTVADAGIFAWLNKWNFEFWRPLTGIREDTENPQSDPFWLTLSAPSTNSNGSAFKPPFPAYPVAFPRSFVSVSIH